MGRKKAMNERTKGILMMVLAFSIIFLGIPLGIGLGNGYNALLTDNVNYSQIENTTAFQDVVSWDGVSTKGSVVSGSSAGANATEETPLWDTNQEWDSVVLTTESTDAVILWNVNLTPKKVLHSEKCGLRVKTNGTKELEVSIWVVKYDGVDLTRIKAFAQKVENGSQEVTWNITPIEILDLNSELNVETTDSSWIQIQITGYDADNKLTTADELEFQFAWETPDNPWVLSSYQILETIAIIGMVIFTVLAVISVSGLVKDESKRSKRRR